MQTYVHVSYNLILILLFFLTVFQVRKKDQINIESKLKTMRFIGELVKFKIFPKTDALHCLKVSLWLYAYTLY